MRAARPFEEESICTDGRPQEALQLPYEMSGSSLGPAPSEELIMLTTRPSVTKRIAQSFLISTSCRLRSRRDHAHPEVPLSMRSASSHPERLYKPRQAVVSPPACSQIARSMSPLIRGIDVRV